MSKPNRSLAMALQLGVIAAMLGPGPFGLHLNRDLERGPARLPKPKPKFTEEELESLQGLSRGDRKRRVRELKAGRR